MKMNSRKLDPGERVLAFAEADPKAGTILLYGEGTFEGMFLKGDEDGTEPIERRKALKLLLAGEPVAPRLRMDNGDIIWGDECHWGDLAGGLEWLHNNFTDIKTTTIGEEKARAHKVADQVKQDVHSWRVDPPVDVRAWRCE